MLCSSTSGSRLKLTVQKQLALYPFLTNNRNMTGSSVEKKCFAVLNVKLQVKHLLFSSCTPLLKRLVLLKNFACPSNKRVIYRPELNL